MRRTGRAWNSGRSHSRMERRWPTQRPSSEDAATGPWWRGAVIYQVYPRSFLDSDGDGVGDLPGIASKLDYIAALGVDAIWISPFFKSPMADFGYDIADYREVDPLFGTLADFDRLEKAHALGLKVVIDQVLSHLGRARVVPRKPRGPRQPEVRLVRLGRCAARRHAAEQLAVDLRRRGLAMGTAPRPVLPAQLLASQPDLDFHNPAVRAAQLDNVRFWLDRGVDGLRLDAINFCFHDAAATTRQNRRNCAWAAASAPTTRTRSSTTGTTTRNRRTSVSSPDCAR